MKLKQHFELAGLFPSVEVLDRKGAVVRKMEPFPNLITNEGLRRIYSPSLVLDSDLYSICKVGTGNSTPSFNDQALDNQVAQVMPNTTGNGSYLMGVNLDENYMWLRLTYTFPLGAIQNQNISEIATGWRSGPGIFSRALVLDAAGQPTSITVLEDEQLRVTWEHRRYFNPATIEGEIANIGNKGGVYAYQIAPAQLDQWALGSTSGSGGIPGIFGSGGIIPSTVVGTNFGQGYSRSGTSQINPPLGLITGGAVLNPSQIVNVTDPGSNSMAVRFRYPITSGNHADGIGSFQFSPLAQSTAGAAAAGGASSCRMMFQCKFDPPIMKTDEDFFEIDFEISWGRRDAT